MSTGGSTPLGDLSVKPLVGPVLPNVIKMAVEVHEVTVGLALQQCPHHLSGLFPVSPHHSKFKTKRGGQRVGPHTDGKEVTGQDQGQRRPEESLTSKKR